MNRALALATVAAIAPVASPSYVPDSRSPWLHTRGFVQISKDARRKPRGVNRADKRLARRKAVSWRGR